MGGGETLAGSNKIAYDFSQWTSAHGVPHVGAANNICIRVFWSVILVISVGMFTYQMYELISKYTDFDVTVQTELKFEERIFPSVTFCNINPYIRKKLEDNKDNTDVAAMIAVIEAYEQSSDVERDMQDQSEAQQKLMHIARHLPDDILDDITYKQNDTIFVTGLLSSCAYNAKACYFDMDFARFHSNKFGSCYTFNPANKTDPYKSTRAGPLYGLRILAIANQHQYLATTDSVGARVVVHGQDEFPFVDSFGYNAAAGFTTSFGIKFVKMERLGEPHGECIEGTTGVNYYYGKQYSVEGGFRSCMADAALNHVGLECVPPSYECLDAAKPGAWCNKSKIAPFNTFNKDNKDIVAKCSRPQPCEEATYGVTVSTALWPSEAYTPPECKTPAAVALNLGYPWIMDDPEIRAKIEDDATENRDELSKDTCVKWFRENTMLIEVYYERMNYQLLKESEAYTLVNLISDMGGQLGLWMGVSVITIIEFLSLLVLLCMFCCGKKNKTEVQDVTPYAGGKDQ